MRGIEICLIELECAERIGQGRVLAEGDPQTIPRNAICPADREELT